MKHDVDRELVDEPPVVDPTDVAANTKASIEFTMSEWTGISAGLDQLSLLLKHSKPATAKWMANFSQQIEEKVVSAMSAQATAEFIRTGKVPTIIQNILDRKQAGR